MIASFTISVTGSQQWTATTKQPARSQCDSVVVRKEHTIVGGVSGSRGSALLGRSGRSLLGRHFEYCLFGCRYELLSDDSNERLIDGFDRGVNVVEAFKVTG